MSTALYRRYRPETFEDVIGQEHVTVPLMQALRTGRVNHAYLFSGPRGCGKTTSARILARCLNCEQGPTPTPCGVCDSCVALARGGSGSVDVIEIDAASHGGVDDARDLRERASYGPAQSRYKVYIIDEAHMVTSAGFNALLKIVEEPPEHVKFIFATTEPEKVIGTIRSRTHHYPFRLVPPARLQDYLEQLAAAEGVAVAPGVLSFVVRAGGGSVRDSLSVLDQLIAGSGPEGLTYEAAAALLGFTDGELLDEVVTGLGARDAASVFRSLDKVIETGLDPRRFVEDLLERLRDLIVVQAVPDAAASVLRGVPEDQLERMRSQAAMFGPGGLSYVADIVNAGLTEMSGATAPRLQLELIAARALLPAAAGEGGYAARLDRLERRLDVGGVPTGAPRPTSAPPGAESPDAAGPTRGPRGTEPGPGEGVRSDEPGAPDRDGQPGMQERSEPATPGSGQSTPGSGPAAEGDGRTSAPDRATTGRPRVSDQSHTRDEPSTGRPSADGSAGEPGSVDAGGPDGVAPRGPGGLDVAALRRAWPDVLAKIFTLRRATWTLLSEHAQVQAYDGERLVLGISTPGLLTTMQSGPHAELVRQALIDVLGVDARVEATLGGPGPSGPGGPSGPSGPSGSSGPGGPPRGGGGGRTGDGRGGDGSWAGADATGGTARGHAAAPEPDGPDGPDGPGIRRGTSSTEGHATGSTNAAGSTNATGSASATGARAHAGSGRPALRVVRDGEGDWSSAPPPASTAPSWATDTTAATDTTGARDTTPAVTAAAGAVAAASAGQTRPSRDLGGRGTQPSATRHTGDSTTRHTEEEAEEFLVSDDDEPVNDVLEAGQSVVERLLGGTVIDDGPGAARRS